MWMADLSMAIGAFDRVLKVLQLPAHVVASRRQSWDFVGNFRPKEFCRGQKWEGFIGRGQRSRAVWSPCFEYNNSMPLILIRNSIERYGKVREKKFQDFGVLWVSKALETTKQRHNTELRTGYLIMLYTRREEHKQVCLLPCLTHDNHSWIFSL